MFQPWVACSQKPFPGLLQRVEHVPLRGGLLDPAGENGRGPLAQVGDPFVGGEEREPRALQVVFDLDTEVRAPGDPVDGLADHRLEVPSRAGGSVEELADASVARDGNGEAFVCPAPAPRVGIDAARLHIPKVRDDLRSRRQDCHAVVQLARNRKRRVLEVFV